MGRIPRSNSDRRDSEEALITFEYAITIFTNVAFIAELFNATYRTQRKPAK
jgi:hypothetical protein